MNKIDFRGNLPTIWRRFADERILKDVGRRPSLRWWPLDSPIFRNNFSPHVNRPSSPPFLFKLLHKSQPYTCFNLMKAKFRRKHKNNNMPNRTF